MVVRRVILAPVEPCRWGQAQAPPCKHGSVEAARSSEQPGQDLSVENRRQQTQRKAAVGLALSFGPLVAVVLVLALRGSSAELTPATALLLLLVVVLGPLLGFVFVVAFARRGRGR
jgi:hypothetical protein